MNLRRDASITTNGRFKVSFLIADFLMWFCKHHSQNLHKFCICEVRGVVARSGQSTPEIFQQEASLRQLCQSSANTFWHVHVVPSALVWQINQNIVDENQSRPA